MGKINELFAKRSTQLESRWNRTSSQLSSQLSALAAAGQLGGTSGAGSIFGSIFSGLGINVAGAFAALTNNETIGGVVTQTQAGISYSGTSTDSAVIAASKLASASSQVASQLQSVLQVILDQLKEAEEAALEMEKEEMLEPVAEKDVEMEMKIATNDTLLTLAETRAEKAKAKLGQYAKDSVAGFGIS